MKIHVGVLTHEEEEVFHLLDVLSRSSVGKVHVLDDCSNDEYFNRLADRCNEHGFELDQRALNDNFAAQRNHLLNTISIGEWVMFLDADELVTPGFFSVAERYIRVVQRAEMFKVWRRNIVTGLDGIGPYANIPPEEPMRFESWEQHVRLFINHDANRYANRVHEVLNISCSTLPVELPRDVFIDHTKSAERCMRQRQFYREHFYEKGIE